MKWFCFGIAVGVILMSGDPLVKTVFTAAALVILALPGKQQE